MNPVNVAQLRKLDDLFAKKGYGSRELDALMESGLLTDLLESKLSEINRNEFRNALYLTRTNPIYEIKLDFTKSLKELIEAGRYDIVDEGIEKMETFPDDLYRNHGAPEYRMQRQKRCRVKLQVRLLPLPQHMLVNDVRRYLEDKTGTRSLTPAELLTLGAQHPMLQKEQRIFSAQTFRIDNGISWSESFQTLVLGATISGKRRVGYRSSRTYCDLNQKVACVPFP